MQRRRQFLRASALATVGVIAGCDGDGEAPTATATATPTPTAAAPTATPTPTAAAPTAREAYPDYTWDQLDGESAVETTTVTLENTAYDPIVASVPAGEPIEFPNEDGGPHTVTIPKLRIDRSLSGGESTTITFEEPGSFEYVCTFHPPDMLGRIVVE